MLLHEPKPTWLWPSVDMMRPCKVCSRPTCRLQDLLESQRGLIVVPIGHGCKALDCLALHSPNAHIRQVRCDREVVYLRCRDAPRQLCHVQSICCLHWHLHTPHTALSMSLAHALLHCDVSDGTAAPSLLLVAQLLKCRSSDRYSCHSSPVLLERRLPETYDAFPVT